MSFYIDVILPLAIPNTFTYRVSEHDYDRIEIGFRTSVPFGKTGIYTALIIKKHLDEPKLYKAKDIFEILDTKPIVTEKQLQHWFWIAEYYMCSVGEVYKAGIPSALLLESETVVAFNQNKEFDLSALSDEEYLLYEAFQSQTILRIGEIVQILNHKKVLPVVESLIQKKMVQLEGDVKDIYKPKVIQYIRLPEVYKNQEELQQLLESVSRSEKQKNAVLTYFQLQAANRNQLITAKDIAEASGVSLAVIKNLIQKEIFETYQIVQDRVSFAQAGQQKIELSEHQAKAFEDVLQSFEHFDVTLLQGITGSGKTEIYIKVIEEFLKKEQQILYLLPEIALTTQLVQRLTSYFGNQVAVFHSKYSMNERVEVWQHILQKSPKSRVVIGARSAVFLPFSDLGLIVVDEEHESSYKQQDPAPRYHARDTAIVLAKIHGAKTLLGSATPSLESYYNTYQNKFGKVVLNKRYGKSTLPDIELVDIKEKHKKKEMHGHFSQILLDEMQSRLALNEQIIIFQNRRGFSPVLECLTCGEVPQCSQCDVSLTYYKSKDVLKCHYCGYTIAKPVHCHACKSSDITTKGFGTEQIELELKKIFPDKKIFRMDQDTTKGKFAFEKLIDAFKNREIDILVGTQMLAKGLDFENVTLVGILSADQALYFPDFRAHERAYQMFMQVAGRAGRKEKKGKVIIQSYNPYHNVIQQVLQNDYEAMFKEQMYDRLNFKYPPFYRLIRLQLKHADFQKVKDGSSWLHRVLSTELNMPVLGPEEPAISRVRNQYIRIILIKIPVNVSLNATKSQILKTLKSFDAVSNFRSIRVNINVDYY